MKHTLLTIATLAALCACTRIEAETPGTPGADRYVKITLSARADNPSTNPNATKSSRDAEGHFYWSPGDQLSLFKATTPATGTTNWQLTSTNTSPAQEASFRGEIPAEALEATGKYWAIYPYAETNSFDGTTLTTTLPDQQTATKGTFSDGQFISVGCADELSMTFYHLCGGFKFKLQSPGITTVTLSGLDDEPLAGRVQVTLDANGLPVVRQVTEPRTTITLSCPDGFIPGEEYFFVTLPVQFQRGIQFTFNGSINRTVETTMRINRAKFQWSSVPIDSRIDDFVYESSNIENDGTKAYLAREAYRDNDYTYSYVADYFSTASDKPLPVSFSWSGGKASVVLSNSPLFTNAETVATNASSPVKVYNLIPGEKYYYKVLDSKGNVLKLGCTTVEGPLRMIDNGNSTHSCFYNVRDLGGWKNSNGQHIAYGKLYRGSSLEGINNDSKAKDIFLNDLGISVDLDLRGYKTSESNAGPVLSNITYLKIPVMKNFELGTGQTERLYKKAIREIIGWLEEGKVVYFHCAAGADRTGTLAFLIEALLGVSESDLSKDFEITSFARSSVRRYRHLITDDETHSIYYTNKYLRSAEFGYPEVNNINELVYNWATTETDDDPANVTSGVAALTPAEITRLRQLLLVAD